MTHKKKKKHNSSYRASLFFVLVLYLRPLSNVPAFHQTIQSGVDSSWNVMAHGEARDGKWRGETDEWSR